MRAVGLNPTKTQNPSNDPLEFLTGLKGHQDHRMLLVSGDKLSLHPTETVTSQSMSSGPHMASYLPKAALREMLPQGTTASGLLCRDPQISRLSFTENPTSKVLEIAPGTLSAQYPCGDAEAWGGELRQEAKWPLSQWNSLTGWSHPSRVKGSLPLDDGWAGRGSMLRSLF